MQKVCLVTVLGRGSREENTRDLHSCFVLGKNCLALLSADMCDTVTTKGHERTGQKAA